MGNKLTRTEAIDCTVSINVVSENFSLNQGLLVKPIDHSKEKSLDPHQLEGTRSIVLYSITVFLCIFVPVLYVSLIRHFYFSELWLENLSYLANDVPGYVDIRSEHAFGIHYFGDYLLPHYWAEAQNPWLDHEIVTYPPVAVEMFKLFNVFPYRSGLIAYELLLAFSLVAPVAIATRRIGAQFAIPAVLLFGFLAGPTIISLDRGNVVGLLPIIYFVFGIAVLNGRWRLAVTAVVIATSLKYFPFVLSIVLLSQMKIRLWIVSVLGSAMLVFGILPFYPGGFSDTVNGLVRGALPFVSEGSSNFSCYNTSYVSGIWHVLMFFELNTPANWIATNALLVAMFVTLIFSFIILFGACPLWSKVVLAMSLSTVITPTVYSYSLNWTISALAIAFVGSQVTTASTRTGRNLSESELCQENNPSLSSNLTKFSDQGLLRVTVTALVVMIVPWPFAIETTLVLGCRTSIIGIVAFTGVSLIVAANIVHWYFNGTKNSQSFEHHN